VGYSGVNFQTRNRGLKPGQATLDIIGGAHKFQGWKYNILTGMGQLQKHSGLRGLTLTKTAAGEFSASGPFQHLAICDLINDKIIAFKWSPSLNLPI
jgi:queuine/archaeosine tRNA-ribosyltransferase